MHSYKKRFSALLLLALMPLAAQSQDSPRGKIPLLNLEWNKNNLKDGFSIDPFWSFYFALGKNHQNLTWGAALKALSGTAYAGKFTRNGHTSTGVGVGCLWDTLGITVGARDGSDFPIHFDCNKGRIAVGAGAIAGTTALLGILSYFGIVNKTSRTANGQGTRTRTYEISPAVTIAAGITAAASFVYWCKNRAECPMDVREWTSKESTFEDRGRVTFAYHGYQDSPRIVYPQVAPYIKSRFFGVNAPDTGTYIPWEIFPWAPRTGLGQKAEHDRFINGLNELAKQDDIEKIDLWAHSRGTASVNYALSSGWNELSAEAQQKVLAGGHVTLVSPLAHVDDIIDHKTINPIGDNWTGRMMQSIGHSIAGSLCGAYSREDQPIDHIKNIPEDVKRKITITIIASEKDLVVPHFSSQRVQSALEEQEVQTRMCSLPGGYMNLGGHVAANIFHTNGDNLADRFPDTFKKRNQ